MARRTGPAGVIHALIDGDLALRLFVNDVYPSPEDTVARLEEADFPGYAPVALGPADWLERVGPPPVARSVHAQEFRRTADGAPQTAHGYYLTDVDGDLRVSAKRFDRPVTIEFAGDRVRFTPEIEGVLTS